MSSVALHVVELVFTCADPIPSVALRPRGAKGRRGTCRLHAARAALGRKQGKSCRLLRSKLLRLR
jgi:hypothetical protein